MITTVAGKPPAKVASEPKAQPAIRPNEPKRPPGKAASEPKEPGPFPVLSDAEADRIEAMIHSGDIGQLEEAARLLGIMDPNTPIPPGILELYRSRLTA